MQEASTAGDGKAKGDAKEGVEKDLVPGVDNLNVDEAPKESKVRDRFFDAIALCWQFAGQAPSTC